MVSSLAPGPPDSRFQARSCSNFAIRLHRNVAGNRASEVVHPSHPACYIERNTIGSGLSLCRVCGCLYPPCLQCFGDLQTFETGMELVASATPELRRCHAGCAMKRARKAGLRRKLRIERYFR